MINLTIILTIYLTIVLIRKLRHKNRQISFFRIYHLKHYTDINVKYIRNIIQQSYTRSISSYLHLRKIRPCHAKFIRKIFLRQSCKLSYRLDNQMKFHNR